MADILYEITGGFFDSVNQDRTYSAEQMNMPYKKIVTDGIFPDKNGGASEDFIVRPDEGMYVSVGIGNALVGGKWAELDSLTVLRVPSNTSAYSRIDSIILRADTSLSVRAVCIVYRQGTEAASPTAPALESSEYVTELRLADITVAAGVSTITAANITDQRGTEECPWVTGAIPPTQAQVSEAVDQYFDENPGIFVVDSAFSGSSTNAVQNKVVKAAVDQLTDDVADLNGRLAQYKAAIGGNNIEFLPRYNAVISGSNVWSTNTNGSSKCVVVPVEGGELLTITHREGITFHLAFLKSWTDPVNGATPDFCSGYASRIVIAVGEPTTTRVIPTDCRYVYILMLNNNADYSPLHFIVDDFDLVGTLVEGLRQTIESESDKFSSEIEVINNRFDGSKKIDTFTLIDGYVNKNTGEISAYSGDGKYKRTDYIQITDVSKIESNFVSNADAGYAFFDENKTYISGGASYPANVPATAEYVILSNYSSAGTHTDLYANLLYRSVIPKTIACYGDSVTEGMRMPDIGTATYGGSCYPSQLQTMLTDMGLNAKVYNYGHSGERSTEVCARIGGRICGYLGEDVTIPANNAGTSLGIAVTTNYKVTGSKLYSTGKNADGTTAQILFTKLGHDTRPLMVGDRLCNIYQAQQDGGMIQTINLVNPTGEETTLPALSVLTTGSSKRNVDICVVYMGINDGSNLTLAEWIDRCKSAIERNPKTLILGATNHNWTYWQGMTGATADAKRAEYLNACLSAFGSYYLDLYDILTTDKCIKIAQAGGYLADRTEAQITADDTALNNRQTPPSLTLEGTAGEVHLNVIGYYVLAKSVCDKLNQLGLL